MLYGPESDIWCKLIRTIYSRSINVNRLLALADVSTPDVPFELLDLRGLVWIRALHWWNSGKRSHEPRGISWRLHILKYHHPRRDFGTAFYLLPFYHWTKCKTNLASPAVKSRLTFNTCPRPDSNCSPPIYEPIRRGFTAFVWHLFKRQPC